MQRFVGGRDGGGRPHVRSVLLLLLLLLLVKDGRDAVMVSVAGGGRGGDDDSRLERKQSGLLETQTIGRRPTEHNPGARLSPGDGGQADRRQTEPIALMEADAVRNEQVDGVAGRPVIVESGRQVQGIVAVVVARRHRDAAAVDQVPDEVGVSRLDGEMERRLTAVVRRFEATAGAGEQLDEVEPAVEARLVERRRTDGVEEVWRAQRLVDVGAYGEQAFDDLVLADGDGKEQGRRAAERRVVGETGAVDVSAVGNQRRDARQFLGDGKVNVEHGAKKVSFEVKEISF